MTAPDPLREDEVEIIAQTIARAVLEQDYMWESENTPTKVDWIDQGETDFVRVARAAILRLDEIREGWM